jgi:hypothetical protein
MNLRLIPKSSSARADAIPQLKGTHSMAEPQIPAAETDEQEFHQVYVGGFTLVKGGRMMANAGGCACYDNMSYQSIQGMWRFIAANPKIQQAVLDFNRIVSEEMTNLGDAYGLARKRVTEADLAANQQLLLLLLGKQPPPS